LANIERIVEKHCVQNGIMLLACWLIESVINH